MEREMREDDRGKRSTGSCSAAAHASRCSARDAQRRTDTTEGTSFSSSSRIEFFARLGANDQCQEATGDERSLDPSSDPKALQSIEQDPSRLRGDSPSDETRGRAAEEVRRSAEQSRRSGIRDHELQRSTELSRNDQRRRKSDEELRRRDTSLQVIRMYQQEKNNLVQIETRIHDLETKIRQGQSTAENNKVNWLEQVNRMIHEINEKFVDLFNTMGCKGEICLDIPESTVGDHRSQSPHCRLSSLCSKTSRSTE